MIRVRKLTILQNIPPPTSTWKKKKNQIASLVQKLQQYVMFASIINRPKAKAILKTAL